VVRSAVRGNRPWQTGVPGGKKPSAPEKKRMKPEKQYRVQLKTDGVGGVRKRDRGAQALVYLVKRVVGKATRGEEVWKTITNRKIRLKPKRRW